jgi:hypothetical protein
MQETQFGLHAQFPDHARHGARDGQPFVDFEGLVDAHADQKDDEVAVDIGGQSFAVDHRDLLKRRAFKQKNRQGSRRATAFDTVAACKVIA